MPPGPTVGKVTALVTRDGASGPEVCVFDHPRAGVQLPAGTLLPGEDVRAGALREAFEETGLEDLRVRSEIAALPAAPPGTAIIGRRIEVGERVIPRGYLARVLERDARRAHIDVDGTTGVVDLDALSFDGLRTLVHMVTEGAAPDEWFVMSQDGGGLCWRCHWLPLEDTGTLTAGQQPWLDVARRHLRRADHPLARRRPAVDPDAQTDLTIELFWAPPWSGTRALVSWLDPAHGPPDELVGRAEAVAVTEEGHIVVVADSDEQLWQCPGGRREPGESLEDTLRREVLEEACARVTASELVGFQRFRHLTGGRAGRVTTDAMFWVRVQAEPFAPRFETCARRLLPLAAARDLPLWANPITQRALTAAADADRHRAP